MTEITAAKENPHASWPADHLGLCFLPQVTLADDDKSAKEDPAATLVEQAAKSFAEGKYTAAEQQWRQIVDKHPKSQHYGVAQFNLGYTLQTQGKFNDAIHEYQKLLRSKVNDQDPGANIMEAYRNYRNKAAKQISACYETQGMHTYALDWAVQARDTYSYRTWCGTCADHETKATAANIARLQRLVEEAKKR